MMVDGQGHITLFRSLPSTTMLSKGNILLLREPTPSSDSGQDRNDAASLDSSARRISTLCRRGGYSSTLRSIKPDANIRGESSATTELLADFILAVERAGDRPAQELPRILPRCSSPKAALLFSEHWKEISRETGWIVFFVLPAAEFAGLRTVEHDDELLRSVVDVDAASR
ncbi:hypothetical protein EV421DRAFT_2019628 [Armillaria borealis]|uniref:Uncharacterized protein n=1 Tax=Armillaria borealis TaxID=47425 RepID=A0AA39MPD1_9AGAR|nr:hypothetical protein EV421DRAFT_2019628 [Armillaria borealis]